MARPKGSVNKPKSNKNDEPKKVKADEPEQPQKTTKQAEASSPKKESAASSAQIDAPLVDPEWAKTSVVDPKTGIHISQWRQEQLRKANK